MATIQAFIRTSTKKADKIAMCFRLKDGRNVQLFHKSDIEVNLDIWNPDKQTIKARVVYDETDAIQVYVIATYQLLVRNMLTTSMEISISNNARCIKLLLFL